MALDRITLQDFRNHAATTLEATAKINLLVGPNGAGKTNVLEALSLLAPGRGLRRASLAEIARASGGGGFAVGASLGGEDGARLGTYTDADHPGRRRVRINGADATAAALGEWLAVGWLTPAMDGLFTAPAADRRRFMDRLALALDPGHVSHVARFERALRERNRLLSDIRQPELEWLDAIEMQLARHGAAVAQGRARLVDTLMAEIVRHEEHPFPRPALTYAAGGPVDLEQLSQSLHDARKADRAAGRTLVGPHRDDLAVQYAAKGMAAAHSSTGEQKALLIAITLAHTAMAARGRPSLLLLDEVAAHLDPSRRSALYERLRNSGAQVWLTGTEIAPFAEIADEASLWVVRGGAVAPC